MQTRKYYLVGNLTFNAKKAHFWQQNFNSLRIRFVVVMLNSDALVFSLSDSTTKYLQYAFHYLLLKYPFLSLAKRKSSFSHDFFLLGSLSNWSNGWHDDAGDSSDVVSGVDLALDTDGDSVGVSGDLVGHWDGVGHGWSVVEDRSGDGRSHGGVVGDWSHGGLVGDWSHGSSGVGDDRSRNLDLFNLGLFNLDLLDLSGDDGRSSVLDHGGADDGRSHGRDDGWSGGVSKGGEWMSVGQWSDLADGVDLAVLVVVLGEALKADVPEATVGSDQGSDGRVDWAGWGSHGRGSKGRDSNLDFYKQKLLQLA